MQTDRQKSLIRWAVRYWNYPRNRQTRIHAQDILAVAGVDMDKLIWHQNCIKYNLYEILPWMERFIYAN